MLIRNAEINFSTLVDIRIDDGVVVDIGPALNAAVSEVVIDANGCALLPGLHDHHLHFMSYAAALDSVPCGPPHIGNAAELAQVLKEKAQTLYSGKSIAQQNVTGWLRGFGYHESVAGDIDRDWLDRNAPQLPIRIQHRSGRLWILNSRALQMLGDLSTAPLERRDGGFTGRLYDGDKWLRARIGKQLPDVRSASARLASVGITGFTDTTPSNDAATFDLFAQLQARGEILQDVLMMGDASLGGVPAQPFMQPIIRVGATKIHLHDNELPDFDALCAIIRHSHTQQRPVAFHCVSLVDLTFALAALEVAGALPADRIEHAAITPPEMLRQIAQLKLIVVTQPNFIAERGAAYLRDVDIADRPWLYRLRGFAEAGISLAAGTDAPFGVADPWAAMQAAVTRRTDAGEIIGAHEALMPEAALELFLGDPLLPGKGINWIEIGSRADFCLLDKSWRLARQDLGAVRVLKTLRAGRLIWGASNSGQ
jgi:predicted amidohydrolase YtcJ